MKCFNGDSFSYFLGAGFTNITATFLISCDFNKLFKYIKIFSTVHLRSFIRYQDLFWIWCCIKFFLHCLGQPNQVICFLFYIIFIVRIRLWIFQAVTLCFVYASETFLFKVFIDACKLQVKWQLIGFFSKIYLYTDDKIVVLV